MAHLLESLSIDKISQIILKKIQPKKRLDIAVSAKFMGARQEADKLVTKFLLHLKNVSQYC